MISNNRQKINNERSQLGFSTLEILLAMTLLIFAFSGAVSALSGNQSLGVDSQTNGEALRMGQMELDNAQARARSSFFAINSTPESVDDIYTKKLKVEWIDDYVKKIKSRVSWESGTRRGQSLELETLVTSPENALRGDTCDPDPSGDWQHPKLMGYVDIVNNEGATGIDTRLRKVYLTTDPSATAEPDFYVIDTADPSHPVIESQLNTGNGLMAVKVIGNYAYAANRSINGQLQVIDVSDPAAPVVKKTFKVPGVTGTGGGGYGKSIFFRDGIIYLGLTKTATGPEFNMIDVSNPLNPRYLGGWQAKTQVNDIYIKDNIAYLATPQPNPSTPQKENLSVLDISDPGNIIRINTFTAADATMQNGESLFFDEDMAYFGRSYGGSHYGDQNKKELYVLNVADPFNISVLGSRKISGGINASIIRSDLLFVITSDSNAGFQIWDIGDLSNINQCASLDVEQTITGGMDCEENLLYIAQSGNRAMQIIGPGD